MFKPISLSVPLAGFASLYALAQPATALSLDAQNVQRAAGMVVHSIEQSQSLFGEKKNAISRLWGLANECCVEDWDGYGALPADRQAIFKAVAFIRALPDYLPLPEFGIDPDGAVSMDWIRSQKCLFSLSINTTDRLACAWIDGTDRGHFVARLINGVIPKRVLNDIDLIMNHDGTTIRA